MPGSHWVKTVVVHVFLKHPLNSMNTESDVTAWYVLFSLALGVAVESAD